jgi:hypothetical protein
MNVHRLVGVVLVMIAASTLWANPLVSRKISNARFPGWVNLQDICTDSAIDQMWRQRLYEIPRGLDGYTMVSYKAARTDSPAKAAQVVKELTHQRRFNSYTAKGYKVAVEPWLVHGYRAVKFTVHGADLTDNNIAHRADLYTFAVATENWFIWLEVRQVINGPELAPLDRAMEKAGGRIMADDLVDLLYNLWEPGRTEQPNEATPPAPVEPPKPAEAAPPVEPPKPAEAAPPVEPPKPAEAAPPVEPPKPAEAAPPVEPPKPAEAAPPVEPPKPAEAAPPVEPPKPAEAAPPVEPPKPAEAAPPVEPPVVPDLPPGTRAWKTPDGGLTLVMPAAWTVAGKTVFTITGPAATNVRLLPPETYRTAEELTHVLKEFSDTQRDISERNFTGKPFSPDGAVGTQVHYTAVRGRTMHMYYLGKAGRLWRLEIDMDGAGTKLTAELEQMVNLITVQ